MSFIVGIGELLWDVYPDGRKVAGGAPFNFAFHCHQLGHRAMVISRVGDDELGHELLAEVRRLGLDDAIEIDRARPTGTVQVSLDARGVPSYTITENVAWDFIGEEHYVNEGLAHDVTAVCFGTLAQRNPTSRFTIEQFVRPGPHMPAALRVFDVNLRQPDVPRSLWLPYLSTCDWIKVNADELLRLNAGLPVSCPTETLTPQRWYDQVWPDEEDRENVLIVTHGEAGVDVVRGLDSFTQPGVPARGPVIDTVGAGDAFTAAMVCLHLEGKSLRECARFANEYAARVCEHRGATPVIDRAEVDRRVFGTGGTSS